MIGQNVKSLVAAVEPISTAAALSALSHPARRYHNLDHILELWAWYQPLRPDPQELLYSLDDKAMASAIVFHDVVYDPRAAPGENEQDSADCWMDMRPRMPYHDRVAKMILATAQHLVGRPTNDYLVELLLDLDLRRLAAPEPQFFHYNEMLREEYHHLTDEQWRQGNSAFLRSIAEHPQIYFSRQFRNLKWEYQVKTNIAQLLSIKMS